MNPPRTTTPGMMAVVAFAALDCFLARFWDAFAGGLLTGLALQVGAFRLAQARGGGRRFWIGFEATGLAALMVYVPSHRFFFAQVVVPWTFILFNAIDRAMTHLPYGAFAWYRKYLYINPNGVLRVVDMIALQEVAFGLPMLLLASAGGLVSAIWAVRRIPRVAPVGLPTGAAE